MDIRHMQEYKQLKNDLLEAMTARKHEEAKKVAARIDRLHDLDFEQPYIGDYTASVDDPLLLGFHKEYWSTRNYEVIKALMGEAAFPHYFLSYRPMPGAKLVSDGKSTSGSLAAATRFLFGVEEPPDLYLRGNWYSYGLTGIIRSWADTLMFIGWYDCVLTDLRSFQSRATPKFRSGYDMVTDLWYLMSHETDPPDQGGVWDKAELQKLGRAYSSITGFGSFRTAAQANPHLCFSLVLDPKTVLALGKPGFPGLSPLCQVPFGMGGYHATLVRDYGYDPEKAPKITMGTKQMPMHAVCGGIWGYKNNVIVDFPAGIVTGTVRSLRKLLIDLWHQGCLADDDMRYLRVLNETLTPLSNVAA